MRIIHYTYIIIVQFINHQYFKFRRRIDRNNKNEKPLFVTDSMPLGLRDFDIVTSTEDKKSHSFRYFWQVAKTGC